MTATSAQSEKLTYRPDLELIVILMILEYILVGLEYRKFPVNILDAKENTASYYGK